jgi:radical SAM protein with 4Fe4S-binding SPASM domain
MFLGWFDTWRLARAHAKPSRFINTFKVEISYFISRFTRKPVFWGMPTAISIEPTTACNLGCPQCPSGLKQFSRPTGKMNLQQFKALLPRISPTTGYMTLYFQGEPFLNKEFTEMISAASRRDIYTATSSNAHFLNPEVARQTVEAGLKRMIISIDGVTQDSYAKYRIGGDLDKVIRGTQNILAARKALGVSYPVVVWQFIVFAHNEHEIAEIRKKAKEVGVDKLQLKTAQIYDFENAEKWLPANPEYARYQKKAGLLALKAAKKNRCKRFHGNPVLTWDGNMVPCCFDKDASHQMGNVFQSEFQDVWKGKLRHAFGQKLKQGRQHTDICNNCTEGVRVWI